MPALDNAHTWTLTLNGVDYWPYHLGGTFRLTEGEGSQIDTLSFEIEDLGWASDPREFWEVIWTADGSTVLFGGYIVHAKPRISPSLETRIWTVQCEGYPTMFKRTPKIRQTWVNATPDVIVAAAFTAAGLAGYDYTNVSNTPTLETFTANGIHLDSLLDDLRTRCAGAVAETWTWRVSAEKDVWLGEVGNDPAPFAIADIEVCDWVTSFPPSASPEPEKDIDATQIANRVTVLGGVNSSDLQTDNFVGDGSTYLFNLTYQPIRSIVVITLDGALQRYGWDWVDDYGTAYDVLIDFESGTVRYPDGAPPTAGQALVVTYKKDSLITATRTSAASYAYYGMYFDLEVENRRITNATMAQELADAILAERAFGRVQGSLTIERLGLHAGQLLTITIPLLAISDSYVIRQVVTELGPGRQHVICTVSFGGQHDKLSLATGDSGQAAYNQPNVPRYAGDIEAMLVKGYDGVGTGQFVAP